MYFHSLTLRLIHKRKILLLCISSILKKECYIVFSYKILVILISTIFLLIGGCGLLSTTRTNNDNFSEKKNEKDKPVQNALNSNNKQNKFLESLQMLSGPVQNSVDDPSAYMKGKVTTGSGTKLRNLKIIYDKKSNQVNGFSLINKSSPRINPNSIGGTPSREYVFEFYDRARQQILLRISDDTIRGGKITHSLMHSNFYFFPRKYLPSMKVKQNCSTKPNNVKHHSLTCIEIMLPTGEKVVFDGKTKEVVAGVLEEVLPIDETINRHNRRFSDIKYKGDYIFMRVDQRGETPENASPWGIKMNKFAHIYYKDKNCKIKVQELFHQGSDSSNYFLYPTDEKFYNEVLNKKCNFKI